MKNGIENGYYHEITPNGFGIAIKAGKVLFSDNSPFQKVEVFETNSTLGRVLTLDDLMMTTEGDEYHYHEMITHIPMMQHKCPKSVLVIGGGDGGTIREVMKHKTVERAVLCEIDGMVIEACKKYLPTISCELDNPKVEILVQDAIEYMKDKKDEFDKIQNMGNNNQRVIKAREFREKLGKLNFLDPACGSGNFLTETYLSLRKMENECLRIITGDQGTLAITDDSDPKVKIQNFYGIEINDFAVSVARTAMWIAESQMWEQTKDITFANKDFLPLDSNDSIYEGNALRMNWEDIVKPYELDYIMGNPPFVGYSLQTKEQKQDIKQEFFKYTDKYGKFDYVSGWYIKGAKYIQNSTIKVGFVSTDSIIQGEQAPEIWKVLFNDFHIFINYGYRSFEWNNEAANKAKVDVVIVGFSTKEDKNPTIYDEQKIISAKHINQYMYDSDNIFIDTTRKYIEAMPKMKTGNRPADGGALILSPKEAKELVNEEPQSKQFIKKLTGSKEFITGKYRYCLWLVNATPKQLRSMPLVLKRVEQCKENRLSGAPDRQKLAATPHLFREQMNPDNYMIVPLVTGCRRKYVPFGYLGNDIIPTNLATIIPEADHYTFGVLESIVHMAWMRVVAGRKGTSYRYSKNLVYTNFPWPVVDINQKEKIAITAQDILTARNLYPDSSLADLYDPLTMPIELRKAHEANDKAVLKVYGLKQSASESEIVQHLFKMYEELTRKDKRNHE